MLVDKSAGTLPSAHARHIHDSCLLVHEVRAIVPRKNIQLARAQAGTWTMGAITISSMLMLPDPSSSEPAAFFFATARALRAELRLPRSS